MPDSTANHQIPFPEGTDPADGPGAFQALAERVDELLAQTAIPTGTLRPSIASAADTGWLLCDGTAKEKAVFPELDALLSAQGYPFGSTATHFNVPDLRGRMLVGVGTHADVNALGDSDGRTLSSRTPRHVHGPGSLAAVSHSHGDGSLAAAPHSHGDGTLAAASHSHGDGTLAAASHSHGNGTLAAAGHSHDDGTLAAAAHSHGDGTLAVDAHQHSFNTDPNADTINVDGFGSQPVANTNHAHTGATANATAGVSGATASNGADVTGATGEAEPAVVGAMAATAPDVNGATAAAAPDVEGDTGSAGADVTGSTGAASADVEGDTQNDWPAYQVACRWQIKT